MESTTMEIGITQRLMDMEFMCGQMEISMWGNGINA